MNKMWINGELEFVPDFYDFLLLVEKHMGDDAADYIADYVDSIKAEVDELKEQILDLETYCEALESKRGF